MARYNTGDRVTSHAENGTGVVVEIGERGGGKHVYRVRRDDGVEFVELEYLLALAPSEG